MRVGFFHIALTLSLLASAGRSSGMTADSDKRLVLIEAPSNRLSKSGKEHLRTSIEEVVTKHGVVVIPSQTLSDKLLRCDLPGCLPQIAAASGATLVLRVEAKFAKETFKLAIELWNSDEGKLLGREARDCPICDEQDLWGSAALLVQGLLDRALQESGNAEPSAADATAPPPFVPPPNGKAVATEQASTSRGEKAVGYAGLGLVVAGGAVLATGLYYVVVDGRPACDKCDWDRDTARYGRPLAIGGGVALAAGAGLLLWRFWPSAPAVSLGPSGVFVAGRFQ